jgi:segregation and condensation protein A
VSFRELTSSLVDRLEVVVRFLAVLELFKQGLVEIDQPVTFGDIGVEWVGDAEDAESALESVDVYDG